MYTKPPFLLTLILLLGSIGLSAQNTFTLSGKVYTHDYKKQPISDVQIIINGSYAGNYTDEEGNYQITLPSNQNHEIVFRYLAKTIRVQIEPQTGGTSLTQNIAFPLQAIELDPVTVKSRKRNPSGPIIINPRTLSQIPSAGGGGIESIIKALPGVSSGNELSAQYNVRGGSFDENLVYVNGFEVFRPQLVRTGQQEGLSFIHPFMVKNISFSAGGFEAKYGDKMSSVLDVAYRTPKQFEAVAEISFLGAELSLGGSTPNLRTSYIAGLRYRSNSYLLNSLDVEGEYNPRFLDFQSLVVHHFSPKWRVEWLTNIAQNTFLLSPVSQQTSFGTVQSALQLFVGMAGNEIMEYSNAMTGLSWVYEPNSNLKLQFLSSGISSVESEKYDIFGAYRLDEIENNMGSDDFGNSIGTLGAGFFINHARNELYYNIATVEHKGNYKSAKKNIEWDWGIGYRQDRIEDRFKEWRYNDSSQYNINPFRPSHDSIWVLEYINSQINLVNHRVQGHAQAMWNLNPEYNQLLTFGLRSHYTSLNGQTLLSPRMQYYVEPNAKHNARNPDSLKADYALRFAAGMYHQPPFYREMRDFEGQVNTQLQAQQSYHLILGMDYYFTMWNRPFKIFTEAYYKNMDRLVPYVIDNMRIRYYADNSSRGYATGIDARINGEFIEGLESWFTLSFLKTDEIITFLNPDGEVVESPWLRRPTDRRVSAALMFQDELKKYPDIRVNLNMVYGAPLPYFLPGNARYSNGFRIPSYQRLDAGFNWVIAKKGEKTNTLSKYFNESWIGLEVFNMLGINNVISYLWVKDISNRVYGVPNFLTSRRVSIRFVAII